MSTGLATRIAALGLWAIAVAERSGDAASQLIEQGIKPPIGSGHPVEVFNVCGIGAATHAFNTMMPPGVKMRCAIEIQQPKPQRWYEVAHWHNERNDRHVVTVYLPDESVFETMCIGSPNMKRPMRSATAYEAKLAQDTLIRMVQAGQL